MSSRGASSATLAKAEAGKAERAVKTATAVKEVPAVSADPAVPEIEVFAQAVREYAGQCIGRPLSVLRAGCVTPLDELGLDRLRQIGYEITVRSVEPDPSRLDELPGDVMTGDFRAISLPPREFDVVYCSLLLDRIDHVTVVLDRLAAALRPGGLLLLRVRDRECAAGFLDRKLPRWVRRALWRRLYPALPGPFPAIYEQSSSAAGVGAYTLMRGLVITARKTVRTLPDEPARLVRCVRLARAAVAWFSRGRLTNAYDEVLLVVRKPQDRFARVV